MSGVEGALRRVKTRALLTAAGLAIAATGCLGSVAHAAGIETVVVTAERRPSDVQSVPFSINAFSGDTLKMRKVDDITDLSKVAPGITFNGAIYRNASPLTMRGASTAGDGPGVDAGVQVYVDDVPTIAGTELRNGFYDLDRIEILRGPQGTLFGRNVTGGLISIHTKAPSFTEDFRATAGYGDYNAYQFDGLATGPLSDTVAAKISLSARGNQGYFKNVAIGGNQGQTDSIAGRAQLLWQPTDSTTILLGLEGAREHGQSFSSQLFGTMQPALPGYPVVSYSPNDTNNAFRSHGYTESYGLIAKIDQKFDFATLTSITAFRDTSPNDISDAKLGVPAPVAVYGQLFETVREVNSQFSEEIRLASNADQRLRWIGGVFYLSQYRHRERIEATTGGAFSALSPGLVHNNSNLSSYAAFGEVSFDILPELTVTAGARYSWETKNGVNSFPQTFYLINLPGKQNFVSPFNGQFQAFTPKGIITYKPWDGVMVYATVVRGFKSGGFDDLVAVCDHNPALPPAGCAGDTLHTPPYAPETSTNFEIGAKTTWLDDRLLFNISLFQQDYKNLQSRVFNSTFLQYFINSYPYARVKGFEAELVARPVDWLTVGGTWTFEDTRARLNTVAPFVYAPLTAPKNAFNIYADVEFPLDDLGNVALGGDITFKSKNQLSVTSTPDPVFIHNVTDLQGQLNLHASWTSTDEMWNVTLWGKNVTNRRNVLFNADLSSVFGRPAGTIENVLWNNPTTYGFTLTYDMH